MLYIQIENGKAVNATSDYPGNAIVHRFQTRNDWRTFEQACKIAHELNVSVGKINERPFIAIDNGEYVSPRYDVIERPMIGDKVSYGFNGDYYPDGEITKVSGQNFRIVTTSTGNVYYRRKLTGTWIKKGGTWALVDGHSNAKNPSF